MPRSSKDSSPEWLIDDEAKFERFLDAIDGHDWLAVDTEANPMHAYRERVCLIQVSSEADDFILDPISEVDLEPFLDLLSNPGIAKIFHDAEYDTIQLRRHFGVQLRGLVDTQVMAVALGESQVGLASLVERYLGVKLDKRYQRSNWGMRPLGEGQLEYAKNDTRYLIPLVDELEAKLDDCDELVHLEIDSEIHRLENLVVPEREPVDPEGFLKLKGARSLNPEQQRLLREIWNWRERESEKRDLPPFKVIGNTQLIALAKHGPTSRKSLADTPGLPPSIAQRHGAALQKVLDEARKLPPYQVEKPTKKSKDRWQRDEREALDRLKRWRKHRADLRPTDPSHILNREVMEELARFSPAPRSLRELAATGLLERWRLGAYGQEILAALQAGAR
ncbi:MAG: 3'-5' exonuclease [Planctomycetota bacterium]|nr:MAG: 3'-5' exonuclease [Planctomycetota bacterium]